MDVVYEEDLSVFDISNIPDKDLNWSPSICPYCGVGCGLLVGSKDGKLHKIRGNPSHPANKGLLCAKGATLAQVVDTPDRLLYPFIRDAQTKELVRSTWSESLSMISEKILRTDFAIAEPMVPQPMMPTFILAIGNSGGKIQIES